MNKTFKQDEKLYRAIYPPEIAPIYWKRNGRLSYTAFIDPNGLSVDRGYYRSDIEAASEMKKRLTGFIARLYVRFCNETGAVLYYLPSKNNKYHTEIHGSKKNTALSKHQAFYLAQRAAIMP